MNYIRKYNELLNPISSFKERRRRKGEENRISTWKYADFNDDDVNLIDDLFLEIQEKYHLEKDINGKILSYININGINNKGRGNPQFFIEVSSRTLVLSIASSKSFITEDLITDIENFKKRLLTFNLVCTKNDIKHTPWIKYISFYINKSI